MSFLAQGKNDKLNFNWHVCPPFFDTFTLIISLKDTQHLERKVFKREGRGGGINDFQENNYT